MVTQYAHSSQQTIYGFGIFELHSNQGFTSTYSGSMCDELT